MSRCTGPARGSSRTVSAWRCIVSGSMALKSTFRVYASAAFPMVLFPGYAFVLIQLQWHAARWAPGTLGLIMDGVGSAHVPDGVIAEIRRREVDGLIELAPPSPLRRGARVRILRGPSPGSWRFLPTRSRASGSRSCFNCSAASSGSRSPRRTSKWYADGTPPAFRPAHHGDHSKYR